MVEQTDPVATLESALAQTGRVLERIPRNRLGDPTPCSEWDLRTLVNHVATGTGRFAAQVAGRPVERPQTPPDVAGGDFVGIWREGRDALLAAWREPDAMTRTLQFPFGPLPAPAGIGIQIVENAVHAWDLAQAAGLTDQLDEEVASAAMVHAQRLMRPERRGPGGPFAPEVEAPEGADASTRLAAFLGRRPMRRTA